MGEHLYTVFNWAEQSQLRGTHYTAGKNNLLKGVSSHKTSVFSSAKTSPLHLSFKSFFC